MEVLIVHVNNEVSLFGTNAFSILIQCRAFDLAAIGTTFNVISYDAVWADHRALGTRTTVPRRASNL